MVVVAGDESGVADEGNVGIEIGWFGKGSKGERENGVDKGEDENGE